MRGFQSPKYSPLDYPIPAETTGRQARTGRPNFGLSDHKPSPVLRLELSANPPPFRPVRPQGRSCGPQSAASGKGFQ